MRGVARNGAIGPAAIESLWGCHPQRAVTVFDYVIDVTLFSVLAWHAYFNRLERKPAAAYVQLIEAFHRAAPYGSITAFEEYRDCPSVSICIFRRNDGKHR